MDNKQIWTTVIVAVVVAVVSSVLTVALIGNAQLGPSVSDRAPPFVNANECTADGICEVHNITLINNSEAHYSMGWIKSLGNIVVMSENSSVGLVGHEIVLTDPDRPLRQFPVFRIDEGEDIYLSPVHSVRIRSAAPPEPAELSIDGSIFSGKLQGVGNAFVCANALGELFRSQTRCA